MEETSEPDHIELGRTFRDLHAQDEADDGTALRATLFGAKVIGWSVLLEERRVVLLAEAGSGKTAEIRAAARRLRAEGSQAFFLRIEHILDHLADAFEVGDHGQFQDWLDSDDDGWLLLDSVDEGRLTSPKDFELAMRTLARTVGPAMQRARILITGRTTAWRPSSDLQLVVRCFPYERPREADDGRPVTDGERVPRRETEKQMDRPKPTFRVVALDDLGTSQIRTFLAAKGVIDADTFLQAVERADAAIFTARPQDLEELIGFWKTHRRIGSRLEIMRESIQRRLAERDPDRSKLDPLTPALALQGARAVAAASVLTRQPLIGVKDAGTASGALSVQQVLPTWNDAQCEALLQRPIFDGAIYGAVRFHHRSVREYLASEWIRDLLEKAGSRRRVENLFFRRQYGLPVVLPSMRPILPWLAILDQGFLTRVLENAPEILFEGGDPRQLPPGTRANILREVCDQMTQPAHGRSALDYSAIQRFAGADIVEDVRELLRRHESDDDISWFLLRMVWQGELGEAAPEVKRAALQSREKYARAAALNALRVVGTPDDLAQARTAIVEEDGELLRDWLDEILESLPVDDGAAQWLVHALEKVEPPERFASDTLSESIAAYVDGMGQAQLTILVVGVAALLEREPVIERRNCLISRRYSWLAQFAERTAARLVELRHPSMLEATSLETLRRLSVARQFHDVEMSQGRGDLKALIRSWPDLNHGLFWHTVAVERALRNGDDGSLTDYWNVSIFGAHWSFDAEDFDEILLAAAEKELEDDRHVALSLAFRIYTDGGRPRPWYRRLKGLALARPELANALKARMRPSPQGRQTWKAQERKWKQESRQRERQEQAEEEKSRKYLQDHLDEISRVPGGGVITQSQRYLHGRMRDGSDSHGKWTSGNWESLATEFGDDVARAFRDGATATWRTWDPPLISEGGSKTTTPFASILGLTGLAIEAAADPAWAATLEEVEVRTAVRYAFEELNGFPAWMADLYAAHPNTVLDMVVTEVEHDVGVDGDTVDSHYALYRVSWDGLWMWDRLGPELLARPELFDCGEANLRYLLKIVEGSPVEDRQIAALASAAAAASPDPVRSAMWFATWVGVEPTVAIPAFESRLEAWPDAKDRTRAAMVFITYLLGNRRSGASTRQAFRSVPHLKSIYILMHRHIRQADDIERAGKGVYSPELRDDAQDARNQIFAFLKDSPGKAAFLALTELGMLHPDESSRPWMDFHAKAKAEQDADDEPWTIGQFLEFSDGLERTPANHRELWELATSRLLDLKSELEESDDSLAPLFMRVAPIETEVRNFVGKTCRDRAHGRYSVTQEEEMADAKRPDLRFHGMGFDAPVPIELKLSDKWPGPRLFERLENQLCRDYLRDSRSTRGILLLMDRGTGEHWKLPNGSRATTLDELVTALEAHWIAISSRFPDVEEVCVIGIDLSLRKPTPTEPPRVE